MCLKESRSMGHSWLFGESPTALTLPVAERCDPNQPPGLISVICRRPCDGSQRRRQWRRRKSQAGAPLSRPIPMTRCRHRRAAPPARPRPRTEPGVTPARLGFGLDVQEQLRSGRNGVAMTSDRRAISARSVVRIRWGGVRFEFAR